MARREFSWDSEEVLGTVKESEKVEHDIKVCTLKDQYYIVSTKRVQTADGWKITKNQTFKEDVFSKIAQMVVDHNKK